MHVHFSRPENSHLDRFSYLVPFLPIWNSAKKGKPFLMGDLAFPFAVPLEIWRGSKNVGESTVSPKEQPVAMHDHHYRSTIYENKAICACFGACRLPTNGAVFTIPALSAFTFAVFTGPVLSAAGVAHALVTSGACPALFTAAGSPDADAVRATVY